MSLLERRVCQLEQIVNINVTKGKCYSIPDSVGHSKPLSGNISLASFIKCMPAALIPICESLWCFLYSRKTEYACGKLWFLFKLEQHLLSHLPHTASLIHQSCSALQMGSSVPVCNQWLSVIGCYSCCASVNQIALWMGLCLRPQSDHKESELHQSQHNNNKNNTNNRKNAKYWPQ